MNIYTKLLSLIFIFSVVNVYCMNNATSAMVNEKSSYYIIKSLRLRPYLKAYVGAALCAHGVGIMSQLSLIWLNDVVSLLSPGHQIETIPLGRYLVPSSLAHIPFGQWNRTELYAGGVERYPNNALSRLAYIAHSCGSIATAPLRSVAHTLFVPFVPIISGAQRLVDKNFKDIVERKELCREFRKGAIPAVVGFGLVPLAVQLYDYVNQDLG